MPKTSKTKSQPAIRTRGLTKFYGKTRGIENLDLRVERGEVFGFLGPNGAGKSTTINLLMGFRKPNSGSARVLGQPIGPGNTKLRARIGFMPGELSLYENMKARDLLRYFGNLRGGVDEPYIEELSERFALDLGKKIKELSKGNKQKVALIQAWMHRPDVLILDEPTSGLDPLIQQEFHELVHESKKRGTTVFLSSHVLSEVEHLCDRAAIIRNGRLVRVERMSSLHEGTVRHLEVTFVGRAPQTIFDRIKGVSKVKVEGNILRCVVHNDMGDVIKRLAKHRVKNLISEHASLEELFFEEYGEEADDA